MKIVKPANTLNHQSNYIKSHANQNSYIHYFNKTLKIKDYQQGKEYENRLLISLKTFRTCQIKENIFLVMLGRSFERLILRM